MIEASGDPGRRSAAVLVFVRAPVLGAVKTRLAAVMGAHAALRVYRRMGEHVLQQARAMGDAVDLQVHYTPAEGDAVVRAWLGEGPLYLPQTEGTLGARMGEAFAQAVDAGYERVVLVGSDLPGLTASHLEEALDRLRGDPVVLGPAADGGYWLIGLRERRPEIFTGIGWGSPGVLADTMERTRTLGLRPAILPQLADVDEVDDLPPAWRAWAEDHR